jgi:hypothetical protein
LQQNRERLAPERASRWSDHGSAMSGNWEAVFGKGQQTDKIFTAWHYANFANEVAAAGKAVYP